MEEVKHHIANVLRELDILSNEYAEEANQWLAILGAEEAVHEVLKTFEQQIKE